MKFVKAFTLILAFIAVDSCTLNLQEDPNNVKQTDVRPTLVLNYMQYTLAGVFSTASLQGMQMTRLSNAAGSIYFNSFSPQSFDGIWSTSYAGILQDANSVIAYADANGWARHAGMARVMQAYNLLLLVDFFGSVPFSDAFKGADGNLNPAIDDQAQLYTRIIGILNKAKLDLLTTAKTSGGYLNPLAETPTDLYYGNSYSRWVRLANSLKLKLFLNMRLVNPTMATDSINSLINSTGSNAGAKGGLITVQSDNFVFRYGTSLSDPDSRHPLFVNNYPAGGGNYMSNHLMWQMYHGYDATHTVGGGSSKGDPRIRFYFYRQVNNHNGANGNTIRCVTATSVPSHYAQKVGGAVSFGVGGIPPGISTLSGNAAWSNASGILSRTFCLPTDVGYWGRDHINPEGIPPDNALRTAWGVYPAGGRFDADQQQSVNATTRGGMYGAGIQPIMMRSYVQFMLAEASLYLTLAGASTPKQYMTAGINNSFTDVRDWAVNGTYGIGSAAATEATVGSGTGATQSTPINTYYTAANYTSDVTNYLNGTATNGNFGALTTYDAALLLSKDDAMNIIAREYWIASFGNGIEALNLYRRNHKPTGFQPAISPSPGSFPRLFFYPSVFATLNRNVAQRSVLTEKAFWDNTTATDIDF